MNGTRGMITAAGETASEVRPARILVVEDEAILRQLTVMTLIRAGYEVDSVQDGQEGWQALHDDAYDLLITDNNMPRLL